MRGQQIENSIYFEPINVNELEEIIIELNPNKSLGIDVIPTKFIKAANYLLAPYLTVIFTQLLETRKNSDVLKIARITSLHKGNSKSEPKNYRPIFGTFFGK